jgi:hypothetical protein
VAALIIGGVLPVETPQPEPFGRPSAAGELKVAGVRDGKRVYALSR